MSIALGCGASRTSRLLPGLAPGCRSAHPRMGGDHAAATVEVPDPPGSPPHGRGPRFRVSSYVPDRGLTPEWARTTSSSAARSAGSAAHPRMGGDHFTYSRRGYVVAGSPPRGRGPRRRSAGARPDGGLTPARAGTTNWTTCRWTTSAAHPRTGGDHQQMSAVAGVCRGLTPARAGTTLICCLTARSTWAHPRTGGDHHGVTNTNPSIMGSPPHGRGPPAAGRREGVGHGLTPARAGTTYGSRSGSFSDWAHPRTGGDHASPSSVVSPSPGSPPHGRGPPSPAPVLPRPSGLTPARAGTTEQIAAKTDRCGGLTPARAGTTARTLAVDLQLSSPPHGRGPPHQPAGRGAGVGLTPARAGTTSTVGRPCLRQRAHPRTGGDHLIYPRVTTDGYGSPPHGRGPPRPSRRCPLRLRLTPARAGTTTRLTPTRRCQRAHPRTGGDHDTTLRRVTTQGGSPPHGRGPHP